jgi:hypothetical protein
MDTDNQMIPHLFGLSASIGMTEMDHVVAKGETIAMLQILPKVFSRTRVDIFPSKYYISSQTLVEGNHRLKLDSILAASDIDHEELADSSILIIRTAWF